MRRLSELRFQQLFHTLGSEFYTPHLPQGLQQAQWVRTNSSVAAMLELDPAEFATDLCLQVFSGNRLLPGMQPLAQAYAGHQFGKFNPFLGDGRSVLLGEITSNTGTWDIVMKGVGRTPYARRADGRAGLDECLHEYHLSEQLAAASVPTSRVLCIISGKPLVYRHGGFQPAAILTRIAPSHIRFGTFEYHYFRRDHAALRQLADHVIARHYPECAGTDEARHARLFQAIVLKTAQLIACWQAVGFTHGVMNTDNQSIAGITLDLGESSFNPEHDPNYIGNREDEKGLHAFGQQPIVGLWNCNALARALSPLVSAQDLREALLQYETAYLQHYAQLGGIT
ncbi:MAG: YdiU family protein [Candidatus Thiothrix moscowensis]|nr:YdiU family protein [Candidatus Thiothrix moscowensis]